ncbi:hypothetical protein FM115_11185 [Marinilactibacillus psychrotolerans 42ea]|uniref:Uncharacterized protein n=1 Tax=Marinilactibacillus psychrotolerans 42ea TaxID=1255609 RepID=A0A1R4KN12_9LACT|nr:hypothetical protein [Marinilactibacillus psychrotolerans]SJN45595.1 hypothetical protein FM115_11185 [Marinilactibacillus psychrotolerans 42ea]
MEDLSMILILAGVFGMFYFWKKDKKKRNIAAIITIISFVIFGFSTDPIESEIESEDVTEEQDVTTEDVVEETNYEYKIVEQEFTQLGDFNRLELRVSTPEEPNKDQIEQLLKQLENEVEENNADYNTEKDDLYIFLFENEIIANGGYTLGRLIRQDGVTEIDARQKDWDEQPNIEEYELYVEFMDKAIELETKAIEEDEDAFIEDNEIAEKVAESKDIDAETVLDSVSKVNRFMMMNQE